MSKGKKPALRSKIGEKPNYGLITALIAAIATIVAATIAYSGAVKQASLPIDATQTAEARLTAIALTAPTPSGTPSLPPNETVFFDANVYHIGDTVQWSPLAGKCKIFDFVVKLPIHDVLLNLEIYDADESALININGTRTSAIPVSSSDETWSENESIPLPSSLFIDGTNSLEFCSVTGREGRGLDDFQIRNIRVEIKR